MQQAGRIYAAVMAAGESTRYGQSKQLVDIGGESLVSRACRVAGTACGENTLLVVGHEWRSVLRSSGHRYFVINENYRSGLGSSIAAAARAVRHTASRLLVTLADQVRVSSADLERLLALQRASPDSIAVARFGEAIGPPVIFPARAFDDLLSLSGPQGAKAVIESGRYPVVLLDCDNARIDIDRPEDLQALDDTPENGRG
ncbi:MAG: nucleotidyltransferase family protein [Woeseiaceae bacterium]|nr:nucleotidyltransferase family protein [Woeseiaceae bacterium]